jgi:hypothetical protein
MSADDGLIRFWENPSWLGPKDLALTLLAARIIERDQPPEVLEIGVWEGSWLMHVARNLCLDFVTGIDPYPGLEEKRQATLKRFAGAGPQIALHPSWQELPAASRFNLIHVDGEHSESAAYEDLVQSAAHLDPLGLIIVDDWMQPAFPGVNSAVHSFLRDRGFRVVLMTEWKVYVTRSSDVAWWRERLDARLRDQGAISHSLDEGAGLGTYGESRRILGEDVIVCLGKPRQNLKPEGSVSLGALDRLRLGWGGRSVLRRRRDS